MSLCGCWLHVTSYHPDKFGVHKACEIGDKTFLISHVAANGHVIKEPSYFMSGDASLQAITLLSLAAIGIVEVKI